MMKKAFTLAEILITLGIIGVVAAMTIPTLMSNTGKAEFTTAYKKIISAVNQAVTMSVAIDYLDFGDANSGTGTDSIYGILAKKMQIAKTATNTTTEVSRMFGTAAASNYTIFFADGMVLSFPQEANHCTNMRAFYSTTKCRAIVDVNGTKAPNRLSNCSWSAEAGSSDTVESDAHTGIEAGGSFCNEENALISDQYSVRFKGQQLIPNGDAARYVLYEK